MANLLTTILLFILFRSSLTGTIPPDETTPAVKTLETTTTPPPSDVTTAIELEPRITTTTPTLVTTTTIPHKTSTTFPDTTTDSTVTSTSTLTPSPPPSPTPTTPSGVNCTLLSDIRGILRSSATARACWSDWSRCSPRTSFFTGILWRNCPNQCRHLGFSGGRCLPSPSINCPCILPGNEQCHCF